MDSRAHAASSSSRSDNHTIVGLQQRRRRSDEYRMLLDSGASFWVHGEVVARRRLCEGLTLDGVELDQVIRASELTGAREKALDLAARREHSRAELERKLRRKRFPDDAIRNALNDLEERGIIDDRRFARLWVEARLRKRPEGRVQLVAGLLQRGVSRDIAERCVVEIYEERETLVASALRRAAERSWRSSGGSTEAAIRRLVRRGFGFAEAREAVQALNNLEKNDFSFE